MKPYGHSRKDAYECFCCGKTGKHKDCRELVDRSNRKTARQEGKKQVKRGLFIDLIKQLEEDGFPI